MKLLVVLLFVSIGPIKCDNYDEDAWKAASEYLNQGYDSHMSPCENFMDYACGTWLNSTSAQKDKTQTWAQSTLITKTLTQAINEVDKDDETIPNFKILIKMFFDRCKENADKNNRDKTIKEMFTKVVRILGTPPIMGKNQKEKDEVLNKNIWNILGHLQREIPSVKIFFSASFVNDKLLFMFVDRSVESTHPRLNPQQVANYTQYVAKLLRLKVDEKELNKKIDNMIKFENELINFYNITKQATEKAGNQAVSTDELEDIISIEDLEHISPNISWSQYFQGLFSMDQYSSHNRSQPFILFEEDENLELLYNVIRKFDNETIFNYIFYQSIIQFYKLILNDSSSEVTADKCSKMVIKLFKSASTRMVFDHLQLDAYEIRQDIKIIAETVFSTFKFLVFSADWLNNDEKVAIIEKANKITFYPGIPQWIKNDSEVERRTISVKELASTVETYITLTKKNFDHDLNEAIEDDDHTDSEPDLEYDAHYLTMHILITAGFLVPPLYHPKYPLSLKYGYAGYTLGHELIHAFDANGVKEIPKGRDKTTWLREDTLQVFTEKRNCLIKQYSSYCFTDKKRCLNGRRSVTENMADMDGLKIAYMAYKFAVQTVGEEPPIPGFLDLTGEQIFFLANARSQCSNGGDVENLLNNEEEQHSPDRARIDVPFRNFPLFAKLFACEVGSNYAPLKTCSLWGTYSAAGGN